MNEITDYWGGWFAGFTDGEGCFSIRKFNRDHPCAGYNCQFRINLRDDDREILEEIQRRLGIGAIYDKPAYTNDGRNNQPSTEFHVAAIAECAELVKVFETYPLRAKKRQDFDIWKLAVAEIAKPIDCRSADLLDYYFLKIKEVRQYEMPVKPIRLTIRPSQLIIDF